MEDIRIAAAQINFLWPVLGVLTLLLFDAVLCGRRLLTGQTTGKSIEKRSGIWVGTPFRLASPLGAAPAGADRRSRLAVVERHLRHPGSSTPTGRLPADRAISAG